MVELRSLNDNRCYEGYCEQPGNASIRVFLSDTHKAEAETNLCIGTCDTQKKTTDSVSVILDKTKYTVIFNKAYGGQDKKAEFMVRID